MATYQSFGTMFVLSAGGAITTAGIAYQSDASGDNASALWMFTVALIVVAVLSALAVGASLVIDRLRGASDQSLRPRLDDMGELHYDYPEDADGIAMQWHGTSPMLRLKSRGIVTLNRVILDTVVMFDYAPAPFSTFEVLTSAGAATMPKAESPEMQKILDEFNARFALDQAISMRRHFNQPGDIAWRHADGGQWELDGLPQAIDASHPLRLPVLFLHVLDMKTARQYLAMTGNKGEWQWRFTLHTSRGRYLVIAATQLILDDQTKQ